MNAISQDQLQWGKIRLPSAGEAWNKDGKHLEAFVTRPPRRRVLTTANENRRIH